MNKKFEEALNKRKKEIEKRMSDAKMGINFSKNEDVKNRLVDRYKALELERYIVICLINERITKTREGRF